MAFRLKSEEECYFVVVFLKFDSDVEGSWEGQDSQEPADNRQAKFIPHGTAGAHLLVWQRIHLHEAASSATRSSMLVLCCDHSY